MRPLDADQHYYEVEESFTRHLDPAMRRRGLRFVKSGKRVETVAGDRVNRFIPNPTFDPVIVPGCLDLHFRGQVPDGVDRKAMASVEPIRKEYRDPDARMTRLDEQGIRAALLFPTMGVGVEEALRDDVPAMLATLAHSTAGSMRTGASRTGGGSSGFGKYPDKWHEIHFDSPQSMYAESNMPAYGWTKQNRLDPAALESHMKALGFPYTAQDIAALRDRTELDALIAYMQVIGTSVRKAPPAAPAGGGKKESHVPNPLANDPKAIKAGAALYQHHCSGCHGDDAKGGIGPSLVDDVFFSAAGDLPDDDYFEVISNGVFAGMVEDGRTAKDTMPGFAKDMNKDKIWSVVAYLRSIKKK